MYPLERKFVKTAQTQMDQLVTIWSIDAASVTNAGATAGALSQIKEAADTVQARGVKRAAMLCEDIFNRLGANGAVKLRPALVGLKTLISQYSEGLFEIDPEFKNVLDGKAVGIVQEEAAMKPLTEAKEKATAVLSPLLKFVKKTESLSALQSLMGQKSTEESTEKTAVPNAITSSVVRFDALMRPVTNLCLSEARLDGKKVSVSYVSDFETLSRQSSKDLQHLLELVFLHITANSIGSEGAQISLTAQSTGSMIDLKLVWNGIHLTQDIDSHTQFASAIKTLKTRGGAIKHRRAELADTQSQLQTLHITFPKEIQTANEQKPVNSSVHILRPVRKGIA